MENGRDGLANDRRFYEEVTRRRELQPYLRDEGVTWLTDFGCGPCPDLESTIGRNPTHIVNSYQGLGQQYRLAVSLYNRGTADGCPGWAVWRLRAAAADLDKGTAVP